MSSPSVLVDTCVWIPFLNQGRSRNQHALAGLLEANHAVIIGPILQEILVGIRRTEQARWIASQLEGVKWIELSRKDFILASDLGRKLARDKHVLPAADLQIASVVINSGLSLWTTDPHFDLIPNLLRFDP